MAEGILGLGSSGSNGLSKELIDKLKAAEARGQIEPYTNDLEKWEKELEKIDEINLKVNELLEVVKNFDLYKSGSNSFEQVSASTTGTSAIFDAVDVSGLSVGTSTVSITQLSQKDVHQSDIFTDKTVQVLDGNDVGDKISITIDGNTYDFTTVGKTYTDLASDISVNSKLTANVEQVGDNSFRLVIKGSDGGTSNDLTISQTGVSLNFTETLNAQNMQATVDGVSYDVSSNKITIQGNLTMTAVEIGTSTISIQKDNSQVIPQLKDMLTKYNELVDLVDAELYSSDSPIEDTGTLKIMMGQIKDKLFASYGTSSDLNLFNYGFSVDKTGHMSIDETVLGKALTDNFDDLKALFVGTAANPGLGTTLKEYVDALDGFEGLLSTYGENMVKRKTDLENDKEEAQDTLDNKYTQMALQFASYTAIITQMEAAFGGMKMMMDQSTAK